MGIRQRSCGRKIVKGISTAVDYLILIGILAGILIALYAMWDTRQVTKEAGSAQYTPYRPGAEQGLSFEELQKLNPEVIGWLDIYGTTIDYPVTQGQDNRKYMNTDPLGEYNLLGAIFLDYRNRKDFSDFSSILYGHHMSPSAMFGDVSLFTEKEFFEEHKYGSLYYEGKEHGLVFFALLEEDAYTSKIYDLKGSRIDKNGYLQYIEANASYYRQADVDEESKLLVCSTCSSIETNGRYVLVAKVTDETYEDPFADEDSNNRKSWIERNLILLILAVVIILLIAAIVTYYIMRRKKKGRKGRKA